MRNFPASFSSSSSSSSSSLSLLSLCPILATHSSQLSPFTLFPSRSLSRLEKRRSSSRRLCISRTNRQPRNVFRRLSTSPLSYSVSSALPLFLLLLLLSLAAFDLSLSVFKSEYARNFAREKNEDTDFCRFTARKFARVSGKAEIQDYPNNTSRSSFDRLILFALSRSLRCSHSRIWSEIFFFHFFRFVCSWKRDNKRNTGARNFPPVPREYPSYLRDTLLLLHDKSAIQTKLSTLEET